MDLNHRPHAYQACALNQLSYRPIKYVAKRVTRIELATTAWKAVVLPLNYTRILPYGYFYLSRHMNSATVPAGIEPAISCVTGRRPNQLDQGTKHLNL